MAIICVGQILNDTVFAPLLKIFLVFVIYSNLNIGSFYSTIICQKEIPDKNLSSWMMKLLEIWNTFGLETVTWQNIAKTICEWIMNHTLSIHSEYMWNCWRILVQRDGTLRLFDKKQHLFMPALAQQIHIQRLSPESNGALFYTPSVIFPFTFWSLCPPYKITYTVYVTKLHMNTDYVLLPRSYACAHTYWLCHVASLCSWRDLITKQLFGRVQ